MSENVPLNSEQGKATIDSLMAKMTPEQQKKFQESLNGDKPVHVHMDKEGNVIFGEEADAAAAAVVEPAPEAPVTVERKHEAKKQIKATAIEQKRQQIFMERLKRKMGEKNKDGSAKTQQRALQEMGREDYDAMPVEKKLERLENIMAQTFRQYSQELVELGNGHMAIADAFDINYRAIQKMFLKLGVPNDEQNIIIAEAQKEVFEERKKAQEARQTADLNKRRAEQDAIQGAAAAQELKKQAGDAEPPAVPAEATTFGG